MKPIFLASILLGLAVAGLQAQVVNPADAQRPPDSPGAPETQRQASPPTQPPLPGPPRLRSWELPPVEVIGQPLPELKEEERIGSYGQPRWTATRRFPGTRVYVVPEGKVEFEYWLRPTFDHDQKTEIRQLWEVEFGLPHRFQLDLYLRTDQEGDESEWLAGQQVELRYAFADWGVIPGNPTLYLEWVGLEKRPDKVEPKLLLGGEAAPHLHWGLNLVAELELGGERENEYQITAGLSYAVIDSKLALGVEALGSIADVKDNRGDFAGSDAVFGGPSVQWRPMPQFTANFAPLFGVTHNSPDARFFVNLGYEF